MTGKIAVGGITRKDGLVLVRLYGARSGRGVAGSALSALGNQGINVTCVTSLTDTEGLNNLCFAISKDDLDQTLGIMQSLQEDIQAKSIEYQSKCSAISIYGPHFSERPAIAGTIFNTTTEAGVEILMISTSFSTVSFLTNQDQAAAAEDLLRKKFLVP